MSENLTQPSPVTQKTSIKFILSLTMVGALVGVALVSMYFPKMINWYFEPTMPVGISCTPSIRWAIEKLQMTQVYALIVGAIIGLLIGVKFKKR